MPKINPTNKQPKTREHIPNTNVAVELGKVCLFSIFKNSWLLKRLLINAEFEKWKNGGSRVCLLIL